MSPQTRSRALGATSKGDRLHMSDQTAQPDSTSEPGPGGSGGMASPQERGGMGGSSPRLALEPTRPAAHGRRQRGRRGRRRAARGLQFEHQGCQRRFHVEHGRRRHQGHRDRLHPPAHRGAGRLRLAGQLDHDQDRPDAAVQERLQDRRQDLQGHGQVLRHPVRPEPGRRPGQPGHPVGQGGRAADLLHAGNRQPGRDQGRSPGHAADLRQRALAVLVRQPGRQPDPGQVDVQAQELDRCTSWA